MRDNRRVTMRTLTLSDGLTLFSLNDAETRFVHREVFGERCYLRHGIELRHGDCVFDVGANIGLATLFFHRERRAVRIFAFEPGPAACGCLKANVHRHGVDARVFECGLSGRSGTADFSFYPANTVRSGFRADLEKDRSLTKTYMVNNGFSDRDADRLVGGLFERVTFPCRLRTLSEVVDEERVARIDLLKIDVEKSERDVLAGIRDEHWGLIRQVVLEVHDEEGGLAQVRRILTEHGFAVTTEQDPLLTGTAVFNVFAIRQPATFRSPRTDERRRSEAGS